MRSIALILAALLTSQLAFGNEAEINYRQSVMKSVGGHMSSMGAILRGRVHSEDLAIHANAMNELSRVVPNVFPEGSSGGKSEALPSVWEKPADFQKAMDAFVKAANGIAEAANSGDMGKIGPAMQSLGQACKGCHDNFRKES